MPSKETLERAKRVLQELSGLPQGHPASKAEVVKVSKKIVEAADAKPIQEARGPIPIPQEALGIIRDLANSQPKPEQLPLEPETVDIPEAKMAEEPTTDYFMGTNIEGKRQKILFKDIKSMILQKWVTSIKAMPPVVMNSRGFVNHGGYGVYVYVSEETFNDLLTKVRLPKHNILYSWIDMNTSRSYSFEFPEIPSEMDIAKEDKIYDKHWKENNFFHIEEEDEPKPEPKPKKAKKSEDSVTESNEPGDDLYMSEEIPASPEQQTE